MKHLAIVFSLFLATNFCFAQDAPKPADPCQKLDTNTIKQLILGTWIDQADTSHHMYFSPDSLVETIKTMMDGKFKIDISYWSYKFVDNLFSTDAVTCYSLRESKEGYARHTDVGINSINAQYMLMGSEGKKVFKKK
jgi:hypothetical protein